MSLTDRIIQFDSLLMRIDEFLKKSKPIHLCRLFEKLGLPVPRYFVGWSNLGGGDHGGADWEPANGLNIAGNHTNIGAFNVLGGRTVYVQPWNGSSYGSVEIHANTISIVGVLTASGRGYGGGGAGGGGGGRSRWAGQSAPGGSGGGGTASGASGSTGGTAGNRENGPSGAGGAGGKGGGTYGGAAVSGGVGVNDGDGGDGTAGKRGGYAVALGQGDGTTDESLRIGGAGGGSSGGGGGAYNYSGGGGGGGGAGNRGGGWIKLYATTTLSVTGAIYAKGTDNSTGNGVVGQSTESSQGGYGSAGGAASASGGSNGAIGGWYTPGPGGYGGDGKEGGYGAGGGILLKCGNFEAYMNLDGTIDNRGGGNVTTNGGTIKVFYAEGSDVTFTHYQGRYYPSQFTNTKPIAPSSPSATRVSDNRIDLGWADNSNIEDGYRIYRSVDGGAYSELKTVAANSTSTSDNTTSANHKYQYKIVAYNGTAESDPIYTGVVYTTPAAPSGCSISVGTINVTWNDNSAYEDGFKIERELDGGGWNLVHTTGENEESWADPSQPTDANEKYQYRVRAYRGTLHSAYSTSGALYQLPPLEEAIALKDVSSMPLGPDIVFEEALALKESLTEISRALLLEEAIALKESLPVIHRQLLPLEEAIAFIESLPVIRREPPPLEEALALAVSFVASEQTVVRKAPSAGFLAEQAKRSNQPAKRIWLYISSSLYDITDKFMSMGPIDRKMTYKPGETKLLTISDQDLVMSNADKYFSDLNPDSPFYDRDYAGADQIKVYAGFIIPSTGYAEVLQKADMKIIAVELMTKEGHAHLRCQDSFREVFDIYVGMPDENGDPDPLIYTDKTFKYIMDDLLINKAGIPSAKVDIEDVTLTFSSISFEKQRVVDCVQKLSEVARGNTVVLGDGTVQFTRFISEVTDVDLIMRSGENYSRLRYVGQDFTLKVNKVVVIGATGVYAEAEISGETGVTLKYENDAILTDSVANDVAAECLGRFAVRPALVEVTGEYLPSLDLKSIVKIHEPNSMMNPAIMQIRELALDIVGLKTRMLLSIPDSAGRSKIWTFKVDWDDGDLTDLYCPAGMDRLEILYPAMSGSGEFIFDMQGA